MDELVALIDPAPVTLRGRRGDSFSRTITIRNGKGGPAIALTGLTGTAQVRRALDTPVVATLTVAVDQAVVGNPTTGQVIITADALVTGVIPEDGVWDCQLTDGTDAFKKTVFAGPTEFPRDVTKP